MLISMISRNVWRDGLLACLLIGAAASARGQPALPGNPNGSLPTELLQARSFASLTASQLDKVKEQFPVLAPEAIATAANWKISPFARGGEAITDDIRRQAGKEAIEKLERAEKDAMDKYKGTWVEIKTEETARRFLDLTNKRIRGQFEEPMIRAHLLWNCPAYRAKPEQELVDGYSSELRTKRNSTEVVLRWPMSWNSKEVHNQAYIQKLYNAYGHGNIAGAVRIDALPPGVDANEVAKEDDEALEQQAAEEGKYRLLAYKSTKLNGMPAIIVEIDQTFEQLGMRIQIVSWNVKVYHGGNIILLSFSCPGPPDSNVGQEKLATYKPLFMLIANSLQVND